MENAVSIIIPHYKTESLIKLCLRSIRHYTHHPNYEVIVVDNDSGSLAYLRQVTWIKLLVNKLPVGVSPSDAHKIAMDFGISQALHPYILAFHSDSIVIQPNWLSFLLEQLQTEELAAIGSYKLELKSPFQSFLKKIEELFKKSRNSELPYIRSHCALYRRDLLDNLQLRFVSQESAGRNIHIGLVHAGYKVKILKPLQLLPYLIHLNHGTMVLNPELGARRKTIHKGQSRIDSFLSLPTVQKIYQNAALDH